MKATGAFGWEGAGQGDSPLLALVGTGAPWHDPSIAGHTRASEAFSRELLAAGYVYRVLPDVFATVRHAKGQRHRRAAYQDPVVRNKERMEEVRQQMESFGAASLAGGAAAIWPPRAVGAAAKKPQRFGMDIAVWKHAERRSDGTDGVLPSVASDGHMVDELVDLRHVHESKGVQIVNGGAVCQKGFTECSLVYRFEDLELLTLWAAHSEEKVPKFAVSNRGDSIWEAPSVAPRMLLNPGGFGRQRKKASQQGGSLWIHGVPHMRVETAVVLRHPCKAAATGGLCQGLVGAGVAPATTIL